MIDLYLASKSARRYQLLKQLGLKFAVLDIELSEIPLANESAQDMVIRLAIDKAMTGLPLREKNKPILGADTCVVVDELILGKPDSKEDAVSMLKRLSGRSHFVYSGVAITDGLKTKTAVSISTVYFKELTEKEIINYWETSEPHDKAGSYAIQGLGAIFVKHIEGSYSGIVGLPCFETAELLREFSITIL